MIYNICIAGACRYISDLCFICVCRRASHTCTHTCANMHEDVICVYICLIRRVRRACVMPYAGMFVSACVLKSATPDMPHLRHGFPNAIALGSIDDMSNGPPSKIARHSELSAFRQRLPYVSQRALAAVLAEAQRGPLPAVRSSRAVRRARDAVVVQETPYGPLHRKINVGGLECEIQNPQAFLWCATSQSTALSNLMLRTAERSPCSQANPWRLMLYFDEVSPGNQLAYRNSRKLWAAYWTIADFGASAISKEDMYQNVACCMFQNLCIIKAAAGVACDRKQTHDSHAYIQRAFEHRKTCMKLSRRE